MAEYAEYQQNNLGNILHFNYGVELFPNPHHNSVIKKSTPTEALPKLKKLLRSNGFAFLTGTIQNLSTHVDTCQHIQYCDIYIYIYIHHKLIYYSKLFNQST